MRKIHKTTSLPRTSCLDIKRFNQIPRPKGRDMAAYQYVYHMQGVSKTYPGGKKCFENIRLSFLPGVKIGVVGVNGAGKSTLIKLILDLIRPRPGASIRIFGVDSQDRRSRDRLCRAAHNRNPRLV